MGYCIVHRRVALNQSVLSNRQILSLKYIGWTQANGQFITRRSWRTSNYLIVNNMLSSIKEGLASEPQQAQSTFWSFGMKRWVFSWKQQERFKNYSVSKIKRSGVPQGSRLGPFQFIVYISAIVKSLRMYTLENAGLYLSKHSFYVFINFTYTRIGHVHYIFQEGRGEILKCV